VAQLSIPAIFSVMIRNADTHERAMAGASNYQEWYEAALAYDADEGMDVWRQEKESDDYDYRLIASRVALIRKLRRQQDYDQLVFRLREELHGNLGNMANPALYNHSKAGTKKLIEDFINEVTAALDEMCDADIKTLPPTRKLRFFKRAARSFGRSALLLSGGASLGLFHVGVVLEMQEQRLLPRVITGSSVGSIVGGVIATHTNPELEELLQPDQVGFTWSRLMGVPDAIMGGSLMDQGLLRRSIEKNIPNLTFLEAYEKTRRILNISVSPADPHQFPRLLNYLTAPNVLIRRATLASCAFPGIFPPVQLRAKNYSGHSVGYMPQSRWIDGSVHEDIPKDKVNRLHNVNHYIVSQTNPHVVPFLGAEIEETGLIPFIQDLLIKSPMIQIEHLLELVHQHFDLPGLGSVIKKAYAVARQTYSGDITIYPESQVANWGKMFANLEPDQVVEFMQAGRRATWPNIERIRNTTQVSRTFDACLQRLTERYRFVRVKRSGSNRDSKLGA
jgi:TAG lipase/steryl ester hydrolase/phospholipase A2/LPA acyltransferase